MEYYKSNTLWSSTVNRNILIWNLKQTTNIISQTNNNWIDINNTLNTIVKMDWCNDYLKYFVAISGNGCLKIWDWKYIYSDICMKW